MSIDIDDHLLVAAQRGDTVALEQVIAQCRPNLRRYASRYCATTSDAEEAVQESLIILYRRLPTLRSVGAFSGWLFQVLQHECQRLARKMFHQHVPLDEAIENKYLTTRTDIELRLDIAMAIQSLPDIYREIIVQRDFEELTVKEIAARLGLSPETVKTRIHRGRLLIREHLLA
jgi:RNA polymerase sigma factor (sigma-70 family)